MHCLTVEDRLFLKVYLYSRWETQLFTVVSNVVSFHNYVLVYVLFCSQFIYIRKLPVSTSWCYVFNSFKHPRSAPRQVFTTLHPCNVAHPWFRSWHCPDILRLLCPVSIYTCNNLPSSSCTLSRHVLLPSVAIATVKNSKQQRGCGHTSMILFLLKANFIAFSCVLLYPIYGPITILKDNDIGRILLIWEIQ